MWRGYPFTAQIRDSETPVLPPVYSTTEPFAVQAPVGFCRFDHGKRHPVLHAAGRVLALKLQQDATAVCGNNLAQGHQGGAADAIENGFLQPAHDMLEGPVEIIIEE